VFKLDDELKAVQESFGVDIPAFNGDQSFELPVPATYLISEDGVVLKSFVEVAGRPPASSRTYPASGERSQQT
jgi:peroxiredoxin